MFLNESYPYNKDKKKMVFNNNNIEKAIFNETVKKKL